MLYKQDYLIGNIQLKDLAYHEAYEKIKMINRKGNLQMMKNSLGYHKYSEDFIKRDFYKREVEGKLRDASSNIRHLLKY